MSKAAKLDSSCLDASGSIVKVGDYGWLLDFDGPGKHRQARVASIQPGDYLNCEPFGISGALCRVHLTGFYRDARAFFMAGSCDYDKITFLERIRLRLLFVSLSIWKRPYAPPIVPRVYSIKREHPQDAIYVGCAGSWKGCKCHASDIKSGSMFGNSYRPREFGGHFKHPIAKTPEEYRKKLDKKWNSEESKDVAWKERAIKELRGKNLLCWCLQPEDVDGLKVTKAEGCHARVLFEYVNRNEGKEA